MSFVAEHRDRFGVEPILRVLGIPVSTFYDWLAQQRRPASGDVTIRCCWAGSGPSTAALAVPTGRRRYTPGYAVMGSGPPASGWSG